MNVFVDAFICCCFFSLLFFSRCHLDWIETFLGPYSVFFCSFYHFINFFFRFVRAYVCVFFFIYSVASPFYSIILLLPQMFSCSLNVISTKLWIKTSHQSVCYLNQIEFTKRKPSAPTTTTKKEKGEKRIRRKIHETKKKQHTRILCSTISNCEPNHSNRFSYRQTIHMDSFLFFFVRLAVFFIVLLNEHYVRMTMMLLCQSTYIYHTKSIQEAFFFLFFFWYK